MIYLLRFLCSLVMVFLSCQPELLSQHFLPQSQVSSRKEAIEHSLEDPRSTEGSSVQSPVFSLEWLCKSLSSMGFLDHIAPVSFPVGSCWLFQESVNYSMLLGPLCSPWHRCWACCSHWSFIHCLGWGGITCHWIWLRMLIPWFCLFFLLSIFFSPFLMARIKEIWKLSYLRLHLSYAKHYCVQKYILKLVR